MESNYHDYMKLENQICFPLYAASRKVIKLYTKWLKPLGITYTQYLVFLVLWEKDEVSMGEICKNLMLENGTLTPLLKKLENAGYIERERSNEDDRVVMIRLTRKGRRLQKEAKDIPQKIVSCVDLPEDKLKDLYSLLYEVLGQEKEWKIMDN